MPLTLLRHTQPRVAQGICYGRTDLDVTDSFLQQAEVAEQNLPPVDLLLSSPSRRCRKLADYIGERRALEVIADARLLELDFGRWEGLPWDEIPRRELDVWADNLLHANPYQGETVAQLVERVEHLWQTYARTSQQVLWVTHAGVIKAASHLAARGQPTHGERFDWSVSVAFGETISFTAQ